MLARESVIGRHGATAVASGPVRGVQHARSRGATSIERDVGTAQTVTGEVAEGPVDRHRDPVTIGVVVGRLGRRGTGGGVFLEDAYVDRGSRGAALRRLLSDAVALAVLQECGLAGRISRQFLPFGHPPPLVSLTLA